MPSSTRQRIIDAAATVLTERGIAGATTREIARAAGCSEALLYKHFADKQEIFLAVLTQNLPALALPPTEHRDDLAATLTRTVATLVEFFARTFPMAVSIFGSPALLAEHRDGVMSRGFGPEGTVTQVRALLTTEQDAGRVRPDADLEAAARLLVGFAFHRAFLAAYQGENTVPDAARFAASGVALVVSALR